MEEFKQILRKNGDSLIITIPYNVVRFSCFQENDVVKILIKKVEGEIDGKQ